MWGRRVVRRYQSGLPIVRTDCHSVTIDRHRVMNGERRILIRVEQIATGLKGIEPRNVLAWYARQRPHAATPTAPAPSSETSYAPLPPRGRTCHTSSTTTPSRRTRTPAARPARHGVCQSLTTGRALDVHARLDEGLSAAVGCGSAESVGGDGIYGVSRGFIDQFECVGEFPGVHR
jgi:hypothetical protein